MAVKRAWTIAGIGIAAAAIAGLLIAVSLSGGDSGSKASPVARAADVFAGIPQSGTVLGKPDAPVTVLEFADLQCPFCAEWSGQTLPTVVGEYVRTGRLKLDFRGLAFIGPDSEKAARAVFAAGRQNRAWEVLEGLYAAQGSENSGWVTDDLIRQVAGQVDGLDVDRLMADRDHVTAELKRAEADGAAAGVRGTPSFYIAQPTGLPVSLEVQGLDPDSFRAVIEQYLA